MHSSASSVALRARETAKTTCKHVHVDKMAVSDDVQSVSYVVPLPVYFHGYVIPFFVLYPLECLCWYLWLSTEAAVISFIITVIIQAILALSCTWSVHIRALLAYKKVQRVEDATMVKVVPTRNNGSPDIVVLHSSVGQDNEPFICFDFQKTRYIYSREVNNFSALKYPEECDLDYYLDSRGLENEEDISALTQKYGLNRITIDLPEFLALFMERATAPFFVFQVFSVFLWCLEDYWYYSIFTLLMLVLFEAILVKQQQQNQVLIKNMSPKPYPLYVYRGKKWTRLLSDSLLPGDIVSLVRYDEEHPVPCDALLLHGQCIVDEALLTGESIPQMKEPISSIPSDRPLCFESDAKLHVISAGTIVAQNILPPELPSGLKGPPDNGCVGFVLRTGFSTSQGRLLRTILFSVTRVTANNLESFFFILFLLVFAIAASVYVWIRGSEDPNQSTYKLLLECVLIVTSVVPPELPVQLSLAVNSSLGRLIKCGIYCTEPFRIPFAGKVDVCCFDKTGTLTADSFTVHGVAATDPSNPSEVKPVNNLPLMSLLVLGSCHSLVLIDGSLVGDPIEVAALKAIDWKLTKNDFLCSKKDRKLTLKIVRRFHFTSSLKRMTVICSRTTGEGGLPQSYICTIKGAAEVLYPMLHNPPPFYEEVYKSLSASGYRVLALGFRNLKSINPTEVKNIKRESIEKEFDFAGFVVTSSPMNRGSTKCIKSVLASSHNVVMITGDGPLTACHVAKDLNMSKRDIFVLTKTDNEWLWQTVDGSTSQAFSPSADCLKTLIKKHDICLTGDGIDYLLKTSPQALRKLLPHVIVFARVTPQQKQDVVNTFKDLGLYTLMCGDGTNDVGALKHAHVGVSLLKSAKDGKPKSLVKIDEDQPSVSSMNPKPHLLQRKSLHGRRRGADPQTLPRSNDPSAQFRAAHSKLQDQLYADSEGPVKLGDASIASPFTYKGSTVGCVLHILRQGRCTLVTTLQMLKILALNSLILAYSQSVLYIHGIKFSDTQYTMQGVLLAACFLLVSQSKPVETLSKRRPLPNFFNLYTISTVMFQFAVHLMGLVYVVQATHEVDSSTPSTVNLDKEFEQNIVNSSVFILCLTMQVCNFMVNYQGRPFTTSLHENKPLFASLMIPLIVVLALVLNLSVELSSTLQVEVFPFHLQKSILAIITADLALTFTVDRLLSFLLARR